MMQIGEDCFTEKIKFDKSNMTDDIVLVLKIGIDGAIEASQK